jgi:hypothetical protein
MAFLTKDRNTPKREATRFRDPVAAGERIFAGAMVSLNSNGYIIPAGKPGSQTPRGMALKEVDNRNGGDGDAYAEIESGVFGLKSNGTITRNQVGNGTGFVDDQTVGDNGSTYAGYILDLEGEGTDAIVWVKVGPSW